MGKWDKLLYECDNIYYKDAKDRFNAYLKDLDKVYEEMKEETTKYFDFSNHDINLESLGFMTYKDKKDKADNIAADMDKIKLNTAEERLLNEKKQIMDKINELTHGMKDENLKALMTRAHNLNQSLKKLEEEFTQDQKKPISADISADIQKTGKTQQVIQGILQELDNLKIDGAKVKPQLLTSIPENAWNIFSNRIESIEKGWNEKLHQVESLINVNNMVVAFKEKCTKFIEENHDSLTEIDDANNKIETMSKKLHGQYENLKHTKYMKLVDNLKEQAHELYEDTKSLFENLKDADELIAKIKNACEQYKKKYHNKRATGMTTDMSDNQKAVDSAYHDFEEKMKEIEDDLGQNHDFKKQISNKRQEAKKIVDDLKLIIEREEITDQFKRACQDLIDLHKLVSEESKDVSKAELKTSFTKVEDYYRKIVNYQNTNDKYIIQKYNESKAKYEKAIEMLDYKEQSKIDDAIEQQREIFKKLNKDVTKRKKGFDIDSADLKKRYNELMNNLNKLQLNKVNEEQHQEIQELLQEINKSIPQSEINRW